MTENEQLSVRQTLDLIADLLAEEPSSLQPDTPLESLEGWDSMGALMIMAEMDERFGLTVTEEDLSAMKTGADFIDLLKSNNLISEPSA
ncbi:MAG: acyl carrier protein [Pseudomonadota bacterium]